MSALLPVALAALVVLGLLMEIRRCNQRINALELRLPAENFTQIFKRPSSPEEARSMVFEQLDRARAVHDELALEPGMWMHRGGKCLWCDIRFAVVGAGERDDRDQT